MVSAQTTEVCNPAKLQGAFVFQLSGRTTISGTSQTDRRRRRLDFDGQGALSGVASVNIAGYFPGNPVTGKYEAHSSRRNFAKQTTAEQTAGAAVTATFTAK
jgi:hypothetical protein